LKPPCHSNSTTWKLDEQNEAVKWMIRRVIKEAHKANAKVGLCGQAPSNSPEFAEFVVECDIDSISVVPDSFITVKQHVAKADTRLHSSP
jgi:pyruvate, water dikinase